MFKTQKKKFALLNLKGNMQNTYMSRAEKHPGLVLLLRQRVFIQGAGVPLDLELLLDGLGNDDPSRVVSDGHQQIQPRPRHIVVLQSRYRERHVSQVLQVLLLVPFITDANLKNNMKNKHKTK